MEIHGKWLQSIAYDRYCKAHTSHCKESPVSFDFCHLLCLKKSLGFDFCAIANHQMRLFTVVLPSRIRQGSIVCKAHHSLPSRREELYSITKPHSTPQNSFEVDTTQQMTDSTSHPSTVTTHICRQLLLHTHDHPCLISTHPKIFPSLSSNTPKLSYLHPRCVSGHKWLFSTAMALSSGRNTSADSCHTMDTGLG